MRFPAVLLVVAVLAGCGGSSLSGDYVAQNKGSPIDKFSFHSGGAVDISSIVGATTVGKYSVNGPRVEITVNGQTSVFTIDSTGCLDAGGMIGKFCKS